MSVVHVNSRHQRIIPFNQQKETDVEYMKKAMQYLKEKGWAFPKGITNREGRKLPMGRIIRLDDTNLVMILGGINFYGRHVDLAYRVKNEVRDGYEDIVKPELKPMSELDLSDDKYHEKSREERENEQKEKELKREKKIQRQADKEADSEFFANL